MNTPSEEQIAIVDAASKYNVVVDAVAGSGKTTTALHIAKAYPNQKCLMLTYSAKLKAESRAKIHSLHMHNITAHSYHSWCCVDGATCRNDDDMRDIIAVGRVPVGDFDIIVLDEVQDMNWQFFTMVCALVRQANKQPRLVIFGDRRQAINGFQGADRRFLERAETTFKVNGCDWQRLSLSMSWRITTPMAGFVNDCILDTADYIKACKPGTAVRFLAINAFNPNPVVKEIISFLDTGYSPEDIFVIAPSVKASKGRQSPINLIENALVARGVNVFIPTADDSYCTDALLAGKIAFITQNQSKGLERPVVIAMGCDVSLFKYYMRDTSSGQCPDRLYVTLTRAQEHLVVVQGGAPFSFLKCDKLPYHTTLSHAGSNAIKAQQPKPKPAIGNNDGRIVSITDLIKYISPEIAEMIQAKIQVAVTQPAVTEAPVLSTWLMGDTVEYVAAVSGKAIPAWHQQTKFGTMDLIERLRSAFDGNEGQSTGRVIEAVRRLCAMNDQLCDVIGKFNASTLQDTMKLALIQEVVETGFTNSMRQFTKFNWIGDNALETMLQNMDGLSLTKTTEFEVHMKFSGNIYTSQDVVLTPKIHGFADAIDGSNVYEFKCVEELTSSHQLQALLYCFMNKCELRELAAKLRKSRTSLDRAAAHARIADVKIVPTGKNNNILVRDLRDALARQYEFEAAKSKCLLFNIRTNELQEITCSDDDCLKIVQVLYARKMINAPPSSDEMFDCEAEVIRLRADDCPVYEAPTEYVPDELEDAYLSDESDSDHEDYVGGGDEPEPTSGMIMVLDTETTGLSPAKENMIELGYSLYDGPRKVRSVSMLVQRSAGRAAVLNSRIHGITEQMMQADGLPINAVLDKFDEDLQKCQLAVAHNMAFDLKFLKAEAVAANHAVATTLDNITTYCTCKAFRRYLTSNKLPAGAKLERAFTILCGRPYQQTHRAADDVDHCADCYFRLVDAGHEHDG